MVEGLIIAHTVRSPQTVRLTSAGRDALLDVRAVAAIGTSPRRGDALPGSGAGGLTRWNGGARIEYKLCRRKYGTCGLTGGCASLTPRPSPAGCHVQGASRNSAGQRRTDRRCARFLS
ncbi:protein of unknown function [Methylorubrum extorquens DM4]|uniref:Uncharacterized protein n=1 Tax=Methylorubrum extorquens (strain DSM 6343 / CIP 106787 / DM4) TaxID=661410 RepID=C7CBA1_METED|nr:protein of unknown function [Methylorubrum extorquens DM4]